MRETSDVSELLCIDPIFNLIKSCFITGEYSSIIGSHVHLYLELGVDFQGCPISPKQLRGSEALEPIF